MLNTISSGHSALRKGRYTEPHRPYILTAVTYKRKPFFSDLRNARTVIHAMRFLHHERRVASMAFVVMPDHFHWLITPYPGYSLASLMHSLKSWTANQLSRRYAISTPVWQPAYHDRALRQDEDIQKVARYIIANPLRAGLVHKIGHYPHWDAIWL